MRPLLSAVFTLALTAVLPAQEQAKPAPGKDVKRLIAPNHTTLPTGQIFSPAGVQALLPGLRAQALALSPDSQLLVTAGSGKKLIAINPDNGAITQEVTFPPDPVKPSGDKDKDKNKEKDKKPEEKKPEEKEKKPEEKDKDKDKDKKPEAQLGPAPGSQASLTGLIFSPDGTRIYLSNVVGNVKVFTVDAQHRISAHATFAIPEARTARRKMEVPTGLALSPDGHKLYVAGNAGSKLHELDAGTGAVLHSWDVGVSPFDVIVTAGKAYVSNSGGRRPGGDDLTAPGGAGTKVRVDPVRHIANEGTVTVIDLAAGKVKAELRVELHASAMALSPDKKFIVVANTGSDTLSVIDTGTDQIVEKISTRHNTGDLFGAQPCALTFDDRGKRLYVCNGTQNSVAVVKLDVKDNASAVTGLIPAGWFPGAVVFDPVRRKIAVANIKGVGAAKAFAPSEKVKFNSKEFFGTVSLVPLPDEKTLESMTATAKLNMRFPRLLESLLPPRKNQPARVVPERSGEPSLIKHVVYVIKENRTYDQVLGDIPTGRGDPALTIFGEKVTPNLHKICREFVLLDNTYCCSVQSADGHQWTDSAIANGYMERQVSSGFPRSYPGGKTEDGMDALGWSSSGFIWDMVISHGKTFRNYGEWMLSQANWADTARKEKPKWDDFYHDWKNKTGLTMLASKPGIATLGAHSKLDTVGWDLNVPDVMRAEAFIKELKEFERTGGFPHLSLLFLPNDHTGGTRGKGPTPAAQVADNDLAMGMVVEALSHSKFWPETCLFAIEDDPQAGWDHVSGYRTTCYVVSPYTKRKQTVSTAYNHPAVLRTIGLMLGLPPMNEMDASSTPMSDCFTNKPDLTPFTAVPNITPLDQLNPEPKKAGNAQLTADAIASEKLNLGEVDRCPEDALNQILWRAMKGTEVPYPHWAVKTIEDDDD